MQHVSQDEWRGCSYCSGVQ